MDSIHREILALSKQRQSGVALDPVTITFCCHTKLVSDGKSLRAGIVHPLQKNAVLTSLFVRRMHSAMIGKRSQLNHPVVE
jgi:hypothetical protein